MYLNITDFKLGLDTRRFMLNSPAGTLSRLVNAHITPGGEIEKRGKFTRLRLPPDCFGLEVTRSGLTVFGSKAEGSLTAPTQIATTHRSRTGNVATLTVASHSFAVGDTVNISLLGGTGYNATGKTITAVTLTTISFASTGADEAQTADTAGRVVLNYTLPAGVTYQQLQHPDGLGTAMTKVVFSDVYDGKAFVIAEFADGATFAFYDGSVILDLYSGRKAAWMANNDALAAHLSALINRSGSYSSSSASSVVTVTTPSGVETEVSVSETSASGTLAAARTVSQVDGINGVSAAGQFTINAGVAAGSTATTAANVTANVATLTFASHSFVTGQEIVVSGFTGGDAVFNGDYTITGTTATQITYALTTADRTAVVNGTVSRRSRISSVKVNAIEVLPSAVDWATSNAATASAVKDAINNRQSAAKATTHRERTATHCTLTLGTHSFLVGDEVTVAGVGGTGYNGTVLITSKTATTITYLATSGTGVEGSTADAGGTVTMVTRWIEADVNGATVELSAGQTGTALNGKVVSVTVDGDVCVDDYSFAITLVGGASVTGVPTVNVFVNGASVTGAVAAAADLETMAVNVAAAVTGYAAVAVGNRVYLSRTTTTSESAPLSVMVIVDSNGGVATGPGGVLTVQPGPANATFFSPATSNLTNFVGDISLYASVSGGTPPYTYKWAKGAGWTKVNGAPFQDTNVSLLFLPGDTEEQPQVKFTRNNLNARVITGQINLTITDAAGRTASAVLNTTCSFYPYT